jgi:hypothetical protein
MMLESGGHGDRVMVIVLESNDHGAKGNGK